MLNGKSRVVLPLYHGCLEPLSGGSPPPIYSLHRFILALQSSSFLSSTVMSPDLRNNHCVLVTLNGLIPLFVTIEYRTSCPITYTSWNGHPRLVHLIESHSTERHGEHLIESCSTKRHGELDTFMPRKHIPTGQ